MASTCAARAHHWKQKENTSEVRDSESAGTKDGGCALDWKFRSEVQPPPKPLMRSTGAGTLSWLCSCKSTVVHKSIIRYLLERMVDSKLSRTSINDAAARLGCTRQTTSTVFRARNDDPPESARDTASA
ncbi:hypothetical protein L917_16961 [Phytophthora nicotianae]|uniref:Uncharacterized protein n=1 Tax=Phytophthora nicotianae TaxID=4792 RepID=W2KF46_PHYNI|nr:hypothetical protein L917_16961 [Phytophthora nicotianae]